MDESVVKHFEQQQVGKLKLSEAIRIGARLTRPTHETTGKHWVYEEAPGKCFSCVIGAAWIGVAGEPTWKAYMASKGGIGDTERATIEHFGITQRIFNRAHADYEYNGKTREEVADWLESQGY